MGDRKLFYARDINMNIVHVDRIKEKEEIYYCPFCKELVIPRMGEKKVWHFAHVGQTCSKVAEELANDSLQEFATEVSVISNIEVPQDCSTYLCPFCTKTGSKKYGIAWKA